MAFRFLMVPVRNPEAAEDELNSFLRSHKVLSIDRRWVDQGSESFWSICVDYHVSISTNTMKTHSKKPSIDYSEVLNAEDFAVFSELRDLRKQVAQADGVAVYLVFTNEQLAQMVKNRATNKADLEKILGAGSARVTQYGESFLNLLSKQWSSQNETSGKPR